jgi:uncharacterized protein involved in response to NO
MVSRALSAHWHPRTLLAAPHRLSFFMAAMVMAASALWWWVEILARAGAWPTPIWAVPATFVHATVMTLGFMPLFFCGFLFTAGPKWLQMPDVSARAILPGVGAMGGGWILVLCGAHAHHLIAAGGAALAALGWLMMCARFLGLLKRSRAKDRLHASVIAAASVLGVLAMFSAALGLALQDYRVIHLSAQLGLWWFIVPVYVAVAHRMIPFFTASALPMLDAWRPNWLLWTLLAAVGLQGLWVVTDHMGWQSMALLGARALTSCVSGALVMGLAVRWGLVQSLRIRLLAMLHIGFVWLGLAMCLDAASALLGAGGGAPLTLLPLHALSMGFLGSVLMAMATRVSCGHGGRTLTADNLVWALFWGLQVAVVLRLSAALWPGHANALLAAAASIWLAAMGGWALRYGRWYGRPRLDGKPG